MTNILFIGDIVGTVGLTYLETHLPNFIQQHTVDFVVANAENLDLTSGGCGMNPDTLHRLFETGVDLVTGGNHSWDAPDQSVHNDIRVLSPLNHAQHYPGRGVGVIEKNGQRLGVINVVSQTTLPFTVDAPMPALEAQLDQWANDNAVDLVLVDFHSESVMEKMTIGFAVAGRVTAVVGTHTHVPTRDTRILPGGTAYVSDVGMTGPSNGLQGYDPVQFVNAMHRGVHPGPPQKFAGGEVEMGAVLITAENGSAVAIECFPSP